MWALSLWEPHATAKKDYPWDRIAQHKRALESLKAALKGLLHRHNDGSDEKWWAEWDTAAEALGTDKEPE